MKPEPESEAIKLVVRILHRVRHLEGRDREIGLWLSAKLEDPNEREEFKTAIREWLLVE